MTHADIRAACTLAIELRRATLGVADELRTVAESEGVTHVELDTKYAERKLRNVPTITADGTLEDHERVIKGAATCANESLAHVRAVIDVLEDAAQEMRRSLTTLTSVVSRARRYHATRKEDTRSDDTELPMPSERQKRRRRVLEDD
jgi:hypothetical protein